jgi:catechol 2,3-dioxygenase-like lactoylglutathione lyase family enzyme
MLSYGLVVLGVSDRSRAERFWCAALGYERYPGRFGGFSVVLVPPGLMSNAIALQPSETAPAAVPRIHLDLHVPTRAEQETEAERLIQLGATRVGWDGYPADPDFIVLADPDGNLFCIVDLGHQLPASSTAA